MLLFAHDTVITVDSEHQFNLNIRNEALNKIFYFLFNLFLPVYPAGVWGGLSQHDSDKVASLTRCPCEHVYVPC